jgi:beta-N-acetylhexosaminidase
MFLETFVKARNLEKIAGRVLLAGLAGPAMTRSEETALKLLSPGGVILFRRNLETVDLLSRLMEKLGRVLPASPWIAVDQEGGRVSRLEPWVGPTVSAALLAAEGGDAAESHGQNTGRQLAKLGFNLDFAPVVDLCPADATNGIGDRSFGEDPSRTTEMAGRFLQGLQDAAVAGCLKHFPGLGDTRVDSHKELPVCTRSLARLQSEDLVPYRTLGEQPAAIMVCHAAYTDPSLAESSAEGQPLPATLSSRIISDLLRTDLAYEGLVVTDDMEMGAVAPLDVNGSAAVAAVRAGVDLLLYCSDLDKATAARDALVQEALTDPDFQRRLQDAAEKVEKTASLWPRDQASSA